MSNNTYGVYLSPHGLAMNKPTFFDTVLYEGDDFRLAEEIANAAVNEVSPAHQVCAIAYLLFMGGHTIKRGQGQLNAIEARRQIMREFGLED